MVYYVNSAGIHRPHRDFRRYEAQIFKLMYLQAQEELEKVLGINIDRKNYVLSIGAGFSAIRAREGG